MREHADREMEKAKTAREDANTLQQAGGSDGAIINRLYYACFHAAQATLYSKGYDPSTHAAVTRLFGREIVQSGDTSPSQGRFLNKLKDLRNDADYGHESIEVDIDAIATITAKFVEEMDELLDS